jgi:hypothetical protein
MSNANPVQPYSYGTDQRDEFEKKGHPGKFYKSITCTSGTTVFTGSNFGVGGVIVTNGTVGTASFSNGGVMPLAALTASTSDLYEFSLFSVKVDSGIVYALVRNQLIR